MRKPWLCFALTAAVLTGCSAPATSSQPSYEELEAQLEEVTAQRDALQELLDAYLAEAEAERAEAAAEPQTVSVGETVSSEQFQITFVDCFTQSGVDQGYWYYSADEGYLFGIAVFVLENIAQEDAVLWPASDFVYYADNQLADSRTMGTAPPKIHGYNEIQGDTLLPAGRAIEGYVVCEIPADTQRLEIEYEGFLFEYSVPSA